MGLKKYYDIYKFTREKDAEGYIAKGCNGRYPY